MTFNSATSDFLLHCKYEKSLSPKTLSAYETDLHQFNEFIGSSVLLIDISKDDLRKYITYISSFKPKSIKRKIATLKALFNHMEFEDKVTINPFRKMKIKIKEPKILCKVMELREIKKVFKVCYKSKATDNLKNTAPLLNIVVIELLFATGARVSEIANLRRENINLQSGVITILGKGNKERIIQVCNNESLTALQEYFNKYKRHILKEGWFLINRLGQKLSDQSIRSIVKGVAVRAGLKRRITPHMFRHTFGTLLLEEGVDIRYIQSLLGHSSITTTQIYTHVSKKRQRQILLTKHPRRDFSMT